MRKFKLSFLGLLFCPFVILAQQVSESALLEKLENATTDSAKADVYIELHNAVFTADLGKAEVYALKVIEYGNRIAQPMIVRVGYLGLARCERKRRDYDKVFAYMQEVFRQDSLLGSQSSKAILIDKLSLTRDYLDADKLAGASVLLAELSDLSSKYPDPAYQAKLAQSYGWYYTKAHQTDKAIEKYNESMKYYSATGNEHMVAESKYLIVTTLLEDRRTESVPEHLFDAINIYKKRNSVSRLADCYSLLGQSYLISGNSQKGIENYKKAIELFRASNNDIQTGLASIDLARCYLLKNDEISARVNAGLAQKIFEKHNYPFGPAMLKTFWGQYYSFKGMDAKAEENFASAAKLTEAENYKDARNENDRYWAQHRYKMNKNKSADSLMLSYASNINNGGQSATALRSLEEMVRKNPSLDKEKVAMVRMLFTKGGPELLTTLRDRNDAATISAMEQFLKINPISLSDSTYDNSVITSDNAKLIELETRYNTKLKDDSLKIQQQSLLLERATSKRKDAYVLGAVMAALLLGAGLFMQYRFRQKSDRDRKTIELLQFEIHHRIKNNLAIIRRLVDVAGKKGADKMSLQSLQTRVAAIEVLHKHLYGEKVTGKVSLQNYIQDLTSSIQTTFATENNIKIAIDAPIEVNTRVAEKIGLITNELITNSIKYAFPKNEAGSISVEAAPVGNKFRMTIADNGIGIPQDQPKNFGLRLIAGLSNEIDGQYSFDNTNGTVFTIIFPDQKIHSDVSREKEGTNS